jgi:RNA polymerase sigma-70 factor (ECF subfamily)
VALRAKSTQSGAGPSDAALVLSAAAGERWAQEALYRRYARLVNGLSLRLLPNRADAADLAQDAFVQAFQSVHRLENRDAFSSFLCSIVVRTAHKKVRRDRLMTRLGLRRNEAPDLDAVVSRTAPPDAQVELRRIYAALSGLPAEDGIALLLRRVEGMTLGEIAEHLGRSLATVKRRVASAEAFLTERFGESDDEE